LILKEQKESYPAVADEVYLFKLIHREVKICKIFIAAEVDARQFVVGDSQVE
jgi:hypothetical protein